MKKFYLGLLIVAGVVAATLLLTPRTLDDQVRRAIEKDLSGILKTSVRVSEVRIDLDAGTAAIKGLTVANPPGYSAEPALEIDTLTARFDAATRVVDHAHMAGPAVRLELKGRESNYQDLQLRAGVGQKPVVAETEESRRQAAVGSDEKTTGSDTEQAKRLVFQRIDVDAATVAVHAEGLAQPETVQIAAFQLRDISGSAGSIAYQIVIRFLQQVTAAADSTDLKSRLRRQLDPDTLKRMLR